jgi:hypothetical protein
MACHHGFDEIADGYHCSRVGIFVTWEREVTEGNGNLLLVIEYAPCSVSGLIYCYDFHKSPALLFLNMKKSGTTNHPADAFIQEALYMERV